MKRRESFRAMLGLVLAPAVAPAAAAFIAPKPLSVGFHEAMCTIPFAKLPTNVYIRGPRYKVVMDRIVLPKFKPGAFHLVNVNDFRRDGAMIPYHADTTRILIEAGWVLHDNWVVDGLLGGLPRIFGVDKNMTRIAPKVHEFVIVTRAPA